jgi:hypothetical protein
MEEPLRYHRTFGLDAEQLDELEKLIEDILTEPWDKGIGRPKSLSLREAIMVTLLYERQHMIEEVIADLFGVSQGTVSYIITKRNWSGGPELSWSGSGGCPGLAFGEHDEGVEEAEAVLGGGR